MCLLDPNILSPRPVSPVSFPFPLLPLLMLLPRALQTGGYGSPSVYGYGYGYSSPAAPAATPLFGKLNSSLLSVVSILHFVHLSCRVTLWHSATHS